MESEEYNQFIMGLDDPVTFSRIVSDNAVSNDSDIPRPLIPTTRNTSKDLIDRNPSPPSPQRQTSLFGLGLDNIINEDNKAYIYTIKSKYSFLDILLCAYSPFSEWNW